MWVNTQQIALVREIATLIQQPETHLAPFISESMVLFVGGLAKPTDIKQPRYVLQINPNNRWLKQQSQTFQQEAMGLHGFFGHKPTELCGFALSFFALHLSRDDWGQQAYEDTFVCSAKDPRRDVYNPLFQVSRGHYEAQPGAKPTSIDLIKKVLGKIDARTPEKTTLKKFRSLSCDRQYQVHSENNTRLNAVRHRVNQSLEQKDPCHRLTFPCSPEVLSRYRHWSPLVPTLNGLCQYLVDLCVNLFGVNIKLSELHALIARVFHCDWHTLVTKEKRPSSKHTPLIMSLPIEFGRSHGNGTAILSTPLEGLCFFLRDARHESEFTIDWHPMLIEGARITAHIPDDDEPPVGFCTAVNIDHWLPPSIKQGYRDAWKMFGFKKSPFSVDALVPQGEDDAFLAPFDAIAEDGCPFCGEDTKDVDMFTDPEVVNTECIERHCPTCQATFLVTKRFSDYPLDDEFQELNELFVLHFPPSMSTPSITRWVETFKDFSDYAEHNISSFYEVDGRQRLSWNTLKARYPEALAQYKQSQGFVR